MKGQPWLYRADKTWTNKRFIWASEHEEFPQLETLDSLVSMEVTEEFSGLSAFGTPAASPVPQHQHQPSMPAHSGHAAPPANFSLSVRTLVY